MHDWSIDGVLRSISENLDDQDSFINDREPQWAKTFEEILAEGGPDTLTQVIESHFEPLHVVEVNTDKDYIVLTNYYPPFDLQGRQVTITASRPLAEKKFVVGFLPSQSIRQWTTNLVQKLNAIDNLFTKYTIDNHPLLFKEALEDSDEFGDEQQYQWPMATFTQLLQNGGTAQVEQAIETVYSPMKVLSVDTDANYLIMSGFPGYQSRPNLEMAKRKFKVSFKLDQNLLDWGTQFLMPAVQVIENEFRMDRYGRGDRLNPDNHPLFFEATSPFTGEEYPNKPWGWQALVVPVHHGVPQQGEGLDDTDEFVTGDEDWTITVTNKNIPGKELSGVVGWEKGEVTGHFPKVFNVDRDDFNISKDFAQKILWAAYWQAEETTGGRTSHEPFELDTYLVNVGNDGIELLKYINDPEHYGKEYPRKKMAGWTDIATHTYGEDVERPIYVNGRPFLKLEEPRLANLQMGAWTFTAPGASDDLNRSADEIAELYEMYISYGDTVLLKDYREDESAPPVEGPGLDEVDEFEEDDPEVDLQRWEDAERLAVRDLREKTLEEFKTLDNPSFELLFVGSRCGWNPDPNTERDQVPFAIIGRRKPKQFSEGLDDKDEFKRNEGCWCSAGEIGGNHLDFCPMYEPGLDDEDQFDPLIMTPVSATIIYDPKVIMRPVQDVIEIAQMIVVDHGHMAGNFTFKKKEDTDKTRIFGTLEVDSDMVDWMGDRGGSIELSSNTGRGVLTHYGEITLILTDVGYEWPQ